MPTAASTSEEDVIFRGRAFKDNNNHGKIDDGEERVPSADVRLYRKDR